MSANTYTTSTIRSNCNTSRINTSCNPSVVNSINGVGGQTYYTTNALNSSGGSTIIPSEFTNNHEDDVLKSSFPSIINYLPSTNSTKIAVPISTAFYQNGTLCNLDHQTSIEHSDFTASLNIRHASANKHNDFNEILTAADGSKTIVLQESSDITNNEMHILREDNFNIKKRPLDTSHVLVNQFESLAHLPNKNSKITLHSSFDHLQPQRSLSNLEPPLVFSSGQSEPRLIHGVKYGNNGCVSHSGDPFVPNSQSNFHPTPLISSHAKIHTQGNYSGHITPGFDSTLISPSQNKLQSNIPASSAISGSPVNMRCSAASMPWVCYD